MAEEDARVRREREENAARRAPETVAAATEAADRVAARTPSTTDPADTSETETSEAFDGSHADGADTSFEAQEAELADYNPPIPRRDGRLYVPRPLYGSLASLLRQNRRDEAEGLVRIQNLAQLNAMRRDGQLVSLPVSEALTVNPQLAYDRRCVRPWTATFLVNLAHAHFVRFHRSLQVTSAVRPVSYQMRLVHINGNAAPAYGDTSSPHERGATIDIGKKGMSLAEIAWMRAYLLPLQEEGKIDVEEEFVQACFHITVYTSYIPSRRQYGRHASTLLATGLP